MHLRLISLFIVLVISSLAGVQARTLSEIRSSGIIRIATEGAFPPFNSVDGKNLVGFEIDLAEAIARRLGLKITWVIQPFDALLKNLNERSQEIDVVIASHAITSTRKQTVDFGNPHYCTGGVILTRTGGPLNSKGLAGRKLGAESGSTYFGFLRKLPFNKNIFAYTNAQAAIQGVALKEVDAIVTDRFAALNAVKTYSKADLQIGETLWQEQIGAAFAKGNNELRQAYNIALKDIMNNGQYLAISRKYFSQNVRCS